MKLASYTGTRKGIMGVGNYLIRLRTGGQESHSEIMFEPGEGCDEFMPDGTCAPDSNGALWHFSSVGLERMPQWSRRRAGRLGGARFKRILPNYSKWAYDQLKSDPATVAAQARAEEGTLYAWQDIAKYVLWILPAKLSRGMCSGILARFLGVPRKMSPAISPAILRAVVKATL